MQLTLVSHYGPKPAPFAEKIRLLQSVIAEQLNIPFADPEKRRLLTSLRKGLLELRELVETL